MTASTCESTPRSSVAAEPREVPFRYSGLSMIAAIISAALAPVLCPDTLKGCEKSIGAVVGCSLRNWSVFAASTK